MHDTSVYYTLALICFQTQWQPYYKVLQHCDLRPLSFDDRKYKLLPCIVFFICVSTILLGSEKVFKRKTGRALVGHNRQEALHTVVLWASLAHSTGCRDLNNLYHCGLWIEIVFWNDSAKDIIDISSFVQTQITDIIFHFFFYLKRAVKYGPLPALLLFLKILLFYIQKYVKNKFPKFQSKKKKTQDI